MRVKEEPYKLKMPASHGRSKGIHVSEVIRDYALTVGILDAKWAAQDFDEDDTTLMQIGLAFENYLRDSKQHPQVEMHFGEVNVECDSCHSCGHDWDVHDDTGMCGEEGCVCAGYVAIRIFMTPDGISFAGDYSIIDWYRSAVTHILHEIKFTKKSSRDFLEIIRLQGKKARMWLMQIKAYLKALDSLAAKLHVCFVNGNYSYDFSNAEGGTVYKIFWLEFTQAEIDENWQLITQHAKGMIQDGKL